MLGTRCTYSFCLIPSVLLSLGRFVCSLSLSCCHPSEQLHTCRHCLAYRYEALNHSTWIQLQVTWLILRFALGFHSFRRFALGFHSFLHFLHDAGDHQWLVLEPHVHHLAAPTLAARPISALLSKEFHLLAAANTALDSDISIKQGECVPLQASTLYMTEPLALQLLGV